MRRVALFFTILCLVAPAALAQGAPHGWLFGTWTGGLFSPPANITAEACNGQPTVIFTQDIVFRTYLGNPTYVQRSITSAQTQPGRTEFRFQPAPRPMGSGMMGLAGAPPGPNFGCGNPDWLPVRRISNDIIEFPGCIDFPFPLRRCPR